MTTKTANPSEVSEIHDGNLSEISAQESENVKVATATQPSMIDKLTSEVTVVKKSTPKPDMATE